MPLRQLQIAVPKEHVADLQERCASRGAERVHHIRTGGGQEDDMLLVVCNVGSTGPMVRLFEAFFHDRHLPQPDVVVVPVTAVVPDAVSTHEGAGRAAWEELRSDIASGATLNRGYVLFCVLSAVMAVLGLLNDDGAVVIAAMVVAPLFGPLMGIALGVVMDERPLWRRALVAEGIGLLLVIAIGVVAGALAPDYLVLGSQQIQSRMQPNATDIVLALGAGVAGALSVASVVFNALVGVAVAVALVPPTIVAGMGIGRGDWTMAAGAGTLVWINVVGGILAAMVTFRLYHIRPGRPFRFPRAMRAVRWVAVAAAGLLLVAAVPIVLATRENSRSHLLTGQVQSAMTASFGRRLTIQSLRVSTSAGRMAVDVSAAGAVVPTRTELEQLRSSLQARLGVPVSITVHVADVQTVALG